MSLEKLRNQIAAVGKHIVTSAQDIRGPKVSDELQKQRIDICHQCPHFYKPSTTCKKCGCFMSIKTWWPRQSCPIGKWGPDPNFLEDSNK